MNVANIVGRPLIRSLFCQNCMKSRFTGTLCRQYSSSSGDKMNVFDRKTKRAQRNRTAKIKDYKVYEYIREEFGWRMADRISDVKRKFDVALDIGCGRGYISRHVYEDMVGTFYQMDIAEKLLEQAAISTEVPTINIHGDEEFLPFRNSSLDLVISSLSLHWVNDLPGAFRQIHNALRPDGCFMGAMFGGDTLFELRVALQLAETEREGGFAPHISPFTQVRDVGTLLTRAGFTMLTIDTDELVINFPSMYELMSDLQGMAENNCAWNRRPFIPRDTLAAASTIYNEMNSEEGKEGIPATFQVIHFIGWKPDPSQAKPAERGSGQVSLKDLGKLSQLAEQVKEMQQQTDSSDAMSQRLGKAVETITKDIDKLQKQLDAEKKDGDQGDGEKKG